MRSFLSVAICSFTLLLAGCASTSVEPEAAWVIDPATGPAHVDLEHARSRNVNGFVAAEFRGKVTQLDDPWGIESARLFFADSESLVIAAADAASQLRAASLAIAQHVPMVTFDETARAAIDALVSDLGVTRVLLVGDVEWSGRVKVIRDTGTTQAIGRLTAYNFTSQVVGAPEYMVQAIAKVDPREHIELKAAWAPLERREEKLDEALPAQSRRDGQMAPIVVVTPRTAVASAANVRAYGGELRVMPTGNPTDSEEAYAMVVGLEDGPLVALGEEFENSNLLTDRIRQGLPE